MSDSSKTEAISHRRGQFFTTKLDTEKTGLSRMET